LLSACGCPILRPWADGELAEWNSVDDDILAEFPPLEQTRREILTDPGLLLRATDVWVRNLGSYVVQELDFPAPESHPSSRTTVMPQGFSELTRLLAYWCDTSQFSIDPEPLGELDAWYTTVSRYYPRFILPPSVDEYRKLHDRALRVIDRMRYAAAASQDLEPPEPVKRPGRPEGSKGSTRKAIEHELSQGTDPEDVANKFDVTRDYVVGIKRESKAEIRQKLSDGQAAADVAEKLDLNAEYVQRIAADMESEVREKLSDGQSAADVAKELKLNPDYVQAIAAELESKTS
jgi:hypothetical protein